MSLAITPIYAAILAIIAVILAGRVTLNRVRYKVDIGDGGNTLMLQTIRVHGNFIEYVPLALILLALVELAGARAWVLHLLGLALLIGRLLHAWGLSRTAGPNLGRLIGAVLTDAMILACAVVLLLWASGMATK